MTCKYIKNRRYGLAKWYECEIIYLLGITYLEVKEDCDPSSCGLYKLLKACHTQRDKAISLETENTNLYFDLRMAQRQVQQLEEQSLKQKIIRFQARMIAKLLKACHMQRDRAIKAEEYRKAFTDGNKYT